MKKFAIVLAVEGLGTNMLGCYGGPWSSTPALDSFASKGIVADQFLLDTDDIGLLYRSLFYGWHASETPIRIGNSVPLQLARSGIKSLLVHEGIAETPWIGNDFWSVVDAELPEEGVVELEIDDWQSGRIPQCIATALAAWTETDDPPQLLWIHCKGWNGPWDAPYVYREMLGDEEDPPPPRGVERPEAWFDAESDPDQLFGWTQAAAAQAKLLDQAWEWIDIGLREMGIESQCLVGLLGLGGYPLGEHGSIGPRAARPFAERMHSPMILRPGIEAPLGSRIQSLIHPSDLYATLLDWFGIADTSTPEEPKRRLSRPVLQMVDSEFDHAIPPAKPHLMFTSQGLGLRLGAWWAHWAQSDFYSFKDSNSVSKETDGPPCPQWASFSGASEALSLELYLHPEDRWQQNDVANRAVDVTQQLEVYRDDWIRWLTEDPETETPPVIPQLLLERPA